MGAQIEPSGHVGFGAFGSQPGRHSCSTSSFEIVHVVPNSTQTGPSSPGWHIATQVPSLVSTSTSQHIAPSAQLSMPLTPEPSTVHGSPGASGSGSIGEQRVAFHEVPPSSAHGMHFSSSGQSC